MARVLISAALQRLCNGKDSLIGDGTTVSEVLSSAADAHPELQRRIFLSDGRIHPQILVYVDGRVLTSNCESAVTGANGEIRLLQIVGGG